jgi:hypothetical protein
MVALAPSSELSPPRGSQTQWSERVLSNFVSAPDDGQFPSAGLIEVFWDDIEEVIKTRAAKVLYVLSRISNAKDGPLKELHFAQGAAKREKPKDFVIPLHIEDLSHGDIIIEITRINTVPCAKSWGAGLAKVLEKLGEDGVPKDPKFDRTAVNDW